MRVQHIVRYRMNNAMYYLNLLYNAQFLRVAIFRNGSPARIINAIRNIIEWKLRRSVVRSRASVIRLEPSAVCNLRCPGCTTPTKTFLPHQVRLMTMDTFARLLEATHKLAIRMTFYMEGEPTTNPRLFEMIGLATKARLFTSISTNFTLMREQWLRPLFESGLDYISICLDGFTQNSYEKYRINGDVSKVKAGLRMLMNYKLAGKHNRPFVNVYSIMFGHVIPEMEQIEAFCRGLQVDQLTFRPDESNFDGTTPEVSDPKGLPLSRCHWPWTSLQVDVDGSIYPCPISFQHVDRRPYGNVNETSLEKIWNNERYVATRDYLSGHIERDDPRAASLPCLKCRWYGNNPNAERPRSILQVEAMREREKTTRVS